MATPRRRRTGSEDGNPFLSSLISYACCIPIHAAPSFTIGSYTNDAVVQEGPGYCALQKSMRADQDRFRIVERFGGDYSALFCGVYDGHGHYKDGVEFVTQHLHKNVQMDGGWPSDPGRALASGFLRTDEDFKRRGGERYFQCGACAIAAVIADGVLTVASAGDCQAVLVRAGNAHNLIRPHRVDTERERIERAGGVVVGSDTKRVNGVLMVTRAIGDGELKDAGVVAHPEVHRSRLSAADEYLIIASDGLWDMVRRDEAAAVCAAAGEPRKAAASLLQLALDRKTTDDTTVVVIDLSRYLPQAGNPRASPARPRSSTAPPTASGRNSIYATSPAPRKDRDGPAPPSARGGTPQRASVYSSSGSGGRPSLFSTLTGSGGSGSKQPRGSPAANRT
eukprot:tig00000158_g10127.t1